MIAEIGYGVLLVTFGLTLFSMGASLYGEFKRSQKWLESGRYALLLSFPLLTLAGLLLIYLLVNGHYEVKYVYSVTNTSMPLYLKITALWGGQAGSLLFWAWLMAAFTSAATIRKWDRDRELLPWVVVVSAFTLAFFIFLIVFFENPFERWWRLPNGNVIAAMFAPAGASLVQRAGIDGQGLNPLLRHPGMIIHPPMLYLGFVGYVIPYAFAMAALITGRKDDRWIRLTRRWSLIAWLFLSLGIVLGGRWAYDVLGWGGYWGWDPVEIASFMPWLTGTAFLHSVMIQEKRGMLKHWNMLLIILTYDLVIFGTFLTRSGVLSSVHSFAQSAIGPAFFMFIGLTLITSLALLIYRWPDLKSEAVMTSMLSREALFLLNNLLFIGILVVCFWGVIFPLLSELVTGQKVTIGPPFYERATGPLFAGILLLMGVAPLSAWGHSTAKTLGRALWKPIAATVVTMVAVYAFGVRNPFALIGATVAALAMYVTLYEFWRGARARGRSRGENFALALWRLAGRNRRRYGGYIIHLAVVMMAVGIIGIELYQTETQGTIAQGESLSLSGYTMTYQDLAIWNTSDGRQVARAVVEVEKNGNFVANLYPRVDYYFESEQPMTIAGLHSTMEKDLYILLINWQPITSQGATFKVYHNPLVNWMWLGAIVFILGTLVAAWPAKETDLVPSRSGSRVNLARAGAAD